MITKIIGAAFIFFGMAFLFTAWGAKSTTLLLGELILSPIFISIGWQLIK